MEFAKNDLIFHLRSARNPYIRFTFLRSDLLCHQPFIDLRNR